MELTAAQGRVLGALVEKERTTPQGYPLTDNALVAACNQTTSRDPVVSYDLATVRVAVRELRALGLLRTVHRTGERSDKHRHELEQALGLSSAQVALLAVLLLRGPQTLAELRARTERLHVFASSEEVERELAIMADRDEPLVGLLPRQPGRKEARFGQLLAVSHVSGEGWGGPAGGGSAVAGGSAMAGGFGEGDPVLTWGQQGGDPEATGGPGRGGPDATVGSGGGGPAPTAGFGAGGGPDAADIPPHQAEGLVGIVAELADEVATLRREVQDLRAALERATGG